MSTELNTTSPTIPSINDPRGMGSAFNDWATGHRWVGVCTENNLQVVARPYPINIPDDDSSSVASAATPSSTDSTSTSDETTNIELPSLVAVQVPSTPIHVKSSFGYWEVHATYDKVEGALNPFSVFLTVPGYGRTCIARDQSLILYTYGELQKDSSKCVQFKVNIKSDTGAKSVIRGVFTLFYGFKDHQMEIIFVYKLKTPYTGKMEDKISIFSASIASPYDPVQIDILSAHFKAMKSGNELLRVTATQGEVQSNESGGVTVVTVTYNDNDNNDHDLLLHFLDDCVYNLGGVSVIAIQSEYNSNSKRFSLSLHFLGACELVGTISPSTLTIAANLFIFIPGTGHVELTSIKGSLTYDDGSGIVGVKTTNDVVAAKGSAQFFAKKNDSTGNHDLYCILSLQVVVVGAVTAAGQDGSGLKIFALPF